MERQRLCHRNLEHKETSNRKPMGTKEIEEMDVSIRRECDGHREKSGGKDRECRSIEESWKRVEGPSGNINGQIGE